MPLTSKGEKIKKNMEEEYGKDKGKQVFYASQNKGTIKGTHKTAELAYAAGFSAKCAELGVDPEALLKSAIIDPRQLEAGAKMYKGTLPLTNTKVEKLKALFKNLVGAVRPPATKQMPMGTGSMGKDPYTTP